MFKKLIKVNLTLIIIFAVVLFVNKEIIRDFLTNHNNVTPQDGNPQIVALNNKTSKNTPNNDKAVTKIAILILDLGLQDDITNNALSTPNKITLGFSHYSKNLTTITQASLKAGHDTMVLLPTQPINYVRNDPGAQAILQDASLSDNEMKFTQILDMLVSNQIGLYISALSMFISTESQAISLITLLEDYNNRIKFFIYYDNDGSAILTKLLSTSTFNQQVVRIDNILDNILSEEDIIMNLEHLKNLGQTSSKPAVGVMYGHKIGLRALEKWLITNSDSVEIVSISDIIKR